MTWNTFSSDVEKYLASGARRISLARDIVRDVFFAKRKFENFEVANHSQKKKLSLLPLKQNITNVRLQSNDFHLLFPSHLSHSLQHSEQLLVFDFPLTSDRVLVRF